MDKRKPTYQLAEIKRLILEERLLIATSARKTINELGFSPCTVREILSTLSPEDFHKSTTEFASHTVWQDVYKKNNR
jgi:motility quorum-sensing regulator / GCU-specific mRNA interferase toxin